MGRWWSPAWAAAEPRSVQLLLLGGALVAASFYAGTLFGSSSLALVLPPSGPRSPVSSRTQGEHSLLKELGNRVQAGVLYNVSDSDPLPNYFVRFDLFK
jgi:hypothetical protein